MTDVLGGLVQYETVSCITVIRKWCEEAASDRDQAFETRLLLQ